MIYVELYKVFLKWFYTNNREEHPSSWQSKKNKMFIIATDGVFQLISSRKFFNFIPNPHLHLGFRKFVHKIYNRIIVFVCLCRCMESRDSDWLRPGRQRGRSSNPGRVKKFYFFMSSIPALGTTQSPTQIFLRDKAAGAWPLTSN
jgi:hypothetical protein